MNSVRLENIEKRFGQVSALSGINLKIEAGELFFLLGPSGCGKSTLLRLIAGLHPPTRGKVFFNDRDVTGLGTEKRNAVMCFQSYALWPHMTVEQNIGFGLEVRGVAKAEADRRVKEAIELVQLEAHAKKKPNEMSGGQQQRVALARALVVKPDCLLLDEPLSNLDAKLRLDMRSEIRKICRQAGLTAIYVTHDQKEALSIADRMAVLNMGKIDQIGKPQDVYLKPDSKFIANFMGETNFLEATVISSNGTTATMKTAIGEVTSSVMRFAASAGAKVTISLRPETMHLGDGPERANRFAGMLHDTIYLGEVAQHQVSIGDKMTLKLFEMNPRVVARDGKQESAKIWFDPSDVVVLDK